MWIEFLFFKQKYLNIFVTVFPESTWAFIFMGDSKTTIYNSFIQSHTQTDTQRTHKSRAENNETVKLTSTSF